MGSLSERDAELIRLKIANRLMDEETKRLQPELMKYDKSIYPAAKSALIEAVSTSSISEKTKIIKQDTSKLKAIETDLTCLNNRVSTLFVDVGRTVSLRDALFSEIEDATSKINSLTIGSSRFEDDSGQVRNNVLNESNLLTSRANSFQKMSQDKLSRLATQKKTQSDLDKTICIDHEKMTDLKARKAEYTSKMDVDSLTQLKEKLSFMSEKTVEMNNYLVSVTNDEGQRLEHLTSSITECEELKKEKTELSLQLEELSARDTIVGTEMEEKKNELEVSQTSLDELRMRKELLLKNHEMMMTELKERTDPLIESLNAKKVATERELEDVKKRIDNRNECLRLKEVFDAAGGKVVALDLSGEIESLKQEIETARDNITKTMNDIEHYRSCALKCNKDADELHLHDKQKKVDQIRMMHEKDGVANHYEMEIFNLKKKLEQERTEKEQRLAQEERRLIEKAKEEKDRREKEERRKKDREIEKKKKMKEDEEKKKKKIKEDEEKKRKKEKEIQEQKEKKKKDEAKNRMINTIQSKDIVSRVQQGRKNMEAAACIPFSYNDHVLMRPPSVQAPLPSVMSIRARSIPKKPMFIYDDDSSEDDDDDMSDFLLDDSARVMPKVPEKYAESPPRVDKQRTPINPSDLSFTDVQSSTPARSKNNPAPAFEVSFNQVVTSTPQIPRGSKANKKQTRARGKKKSN